MTTIEDIIRGIVREELRAASPDNAQQPADSATGTTPAAPQKRGRGRPVKGEEAAPAAPAPAPAAPEADPFDAAPAAPQSPAATLEEVRAALKAHAAATTQAVALQLLKDVGGADNLTTLAAEKYGLVVAAVKAAKPATPAPEVDPFDAPAPAPAAPAAAVITLDQVKAAVVAATKRTAADTVQKVVMQHGGKAKNADTGVEGPSLKALPESAYAAVIAAVNALPSTK